MNPQKTANDLLETIPKENAIAHCEFVLSPGYGLRKKELRDFWEEVRSILKQQMHEI